MAEIYEFLNSNYKEMRGIFLVLLLIFYLIDNFLFIFIAKQKYSINFWYFNLYQKHGFKKVTIFKVIFVLFQIYLLYSPPIRVTDPFVIVCFYITVVIVAIYKTIRLRTSNPP